MQIYSWNMLYRNARQDEAFDFISKTPFDLFCLQEVPEAFLKRLKTLPYHLDYRIDTERHPRSGTMHMYGVVLSRYPLSNKHEISYPEYWHLLPWRTRAFVTLMPDRYFTRIGNRGGFSVDLKLPQGPVRVFNLHLILAHPTWRLKEFELAMLYHDKTLPTIVCGDFNILEKPHITPLNWLLGGRVSDALSVTRERAHIEKRFVTYELTNALSGEMTHPVSRSQLDHILVSRSFSITSASVLPDRLGSDHHPIHVEVSA
ncbi:MAG: endonuclease/exonuclease/phosphatase family protein [Patescibacteria group bacterium]